MNVNRRDFSLGAAGAALVPTALLAPVARAQGGKPVAGRDYQVLNERVSTEAPTGSVEVVEFFSYMCHICNAFEPTFYAWTKTLPKGVVLRRVPAPFLQNYEVLQRTYFVIEQLKLVDTLHGKVFDAIHDERRNFNDVAVMADWMATQGVDRAKFMSQYSSFTVVTKAAQATQLTNAYKIEGVPMLGVAGRYLTEGTAKGLRVVESLVADIRARG